MARFGSDIVSSPFHGPAGRIIAMLLTKFAGLFSLYKSAPVISLHINLNRTLRTSVKINPECTSPVHCRNSSPLPGKTTPAARCTFPVIECQASCLALDTSVYSSLAKGAAFDSYNRQPFHCRIRIGANRLANVIS